MRKEAIRSGKNIKHHSVKKITHHVHKLRHVHKKTNEWINRAWSFIGVLVLLFGFGIFCWMVKEMARVGVLGISIHP